MAAVRATTEAIGLVQLAESWGVRATSSVLVDSSAALAIVARKGNGKLRHVKVGHLWIQEKAAVGEGKKLGSETAQWDQNQGT